MTTRGRKSSKKHYYRVLHDGYWNAGSKLRPNSVFFNFFFQSYDKVITECVLSVTAGKQNVTCEVLNDTVTASECVKFFSLFLSDA